MTTYLTRLRQLPAIWDSLEAIEIRGHSDAGSARAGSSAGWVGSQQRALATLLFLVGPDGITAEADRADLERLAVVSGTSFSRPPLDCPEVSPECRPRWRRVEIRPVLSESLRRGDWARTLEDLRSSTASLRSDLQP
jgi:flagellar motor protein MotB